MTTKPLPNRRRALIVCAFSALTALICAGLLGAAVLASAPAAVIPVIAMICVGLPVLASWDLPISIAVLRASRSGERPLDGRALVTLRRNLDRLPETPHPLGL